MRACWLKWVGRDWSISADYIWLNYSGANTAENVSAVFGKDGVETEIQVGQMRQTLGKSGFDWLFNKH